MRPSYLTIRLALLGLAFVIVGGCGKKPDEHHGHDHENEGHGHDHSEEAPTGTSYKTGTGVLLNDETRESLGLTTAPVSSRKLWAEIRFNAQVFGETHEPTAEDTEHAKCTAKASGLLAQNQSSSLSPGQPVRLTSKSGEALGGMVLRVNKSLAIGDAEVIVGITNAGAKVKAGEFLLTSITIPREKPCLVVPKSAVLRTADGTFVYAVNGNAYLRSAVQPGVEAEGFIEVIDGLSNSAVVVTKPVEELWLIELRATKGGGHSH